MIECLCIPNRPSFRESRICKFGFEQFTELRDTCKIYAIDLFVSFLECLFSFGEFLQLLGRVV